MQDKCRFLKRGLSWMTLVFFTVFSVMPTSAYAAVTQTVGADGKIVYTTDSDTVWEVGNFDQAAGAVWEFNLGRGNLQVNVNGPQATTWSGFTTIRDGLFSMFNPNGIHFTETSRVNLSNASFIAAAMKAVEGTNLNNFKLKGNGYLLNEGKISGGDVALLGGAVENKGIIEAPLNQITLAGGKAITVGLSGDNLVSVVVDEATDTSVKDFSGKALSDQIKNSGNLTGHKVTLDAKGVDSVFEKAINLKGEVKAVDVGEVDGTLRMLSMDDVYSLAILEASKIFIRAGEGDIDMLGVTRAEELDEKGASFQIGGTFEVENSYHDNLDNAITYAANTNVSGNINDDENILINENVVLTMTGDTSFFADSDGNGSGSFGMHSTARINGNAHDLSITASQDSTLGIIDDVDLLTLSRNNPASDPIFTSSTTVDDIDVNTFKTNNGVTFMKTVGSGADADNARLIYDVTQLQGMSNNLGYYYKLANNIDASATEDWNSGTGFSSVGDNASNFTGNFDGQNYSVSDLFINRPSTSYIGLFGRASGAGSIQNVRLLNVDITGQNQVGGLVGSILSRTVSSSYVTGNVAGGTDVGGLVGANSSASTVSNSFSAATVTGSGSTGGLVGGSYGASNVINSYATGSVSGNNNVGGLLGFNRDGSSITSSYSSGLVSGSSSVGGLLGGSFSGGAVTSSYWNTQTSGLGTSDGGTGLTTAQMNDSSSFSGWDFDANGVSAGNNGVWIMAGLPHLQMEWSANISTLAQLQMMSLDLDASYTLANNIDASLTSSWNSGAGFNPVGTLAAPFTGDFDGQNYVVDSLYINRPAASNVGLFGQNSNISTIQNVGLTNVNVTGQFSVGALSGDQSGTVTNAYSSGVVNGVSSVGGLIGRQPSGSVTGSHSSANVTGTGSNLGGLIGTFQNASISDSYATGNVTGQSGHSGIGGLLGGSFQSTIVRSFATGNIGGGSAGQGGFAGWVNGGSVTDSYATGNVTGASGSSEIGGFIGMAGFGATVARSYSTGVLTNATGGFLGASNTVGNGVAGTMTANYWNYENSSLASTQDSGDQGNIAGVTGLTAAQMQDSANFSGWDFDANGVSAGNNGNWIMAGLPHLQAEWSSTISTLAQLQMMALDLDANYTLANNIDASATSAWNAGAGFNPIGNNAARFVGSFDGNNYEISDLFISRAGTDYVGLFGMMISGGRIQNVGLVDADITGNDSVGGLIGYSAWNGLIENVYTTGVVTGLSAHVGGLIGQSYDTDVTDSYSSADVSGDYSLGGLIGYDGQASVISKSYATGSVVGNSSVGGFIGSATETVISESYSTGNVTATNGNHAAGFIASGLSVNVSNSYSLGDVVGNDLVAGFIVYAQDGSITNSYSAGLVTADSGSTYVGGFIAYNNGSAVTNSYWDTQTSGQSSSDGGTGLTTAQMRDSSNFSGWDFNTIWVSAGAPDLRTEYNVWQGSANGNWSDAVNWTKGAITAASKVMFNSTSTANSMINAGFGGAITKLFIDAGYSGTVSQNRSLSVSGDYFQKSGTYNSNGQNLTVDGLTTIQSSTYTGSTGTTTFTGGLDLTAATLTTSGAGSIIVGDDIRTRASAASSTINGNLNLGGATRAFTVDDGAAAMDLEIAAVMVNGGITKEGAGKMVLSGNNTYAGATNVNAGALSVRHSNGLGSNGDGTAVASGAVLELEGGVSLTEGLVLGGSGASGGGVLRSVSGANSVTGVTALNSDITIGVDDGSLTLGVVGNVPGIYDLTKLGSGNLVFSDQISIRDLAVTGGTISGTGNVFVDGGDVSGNGTIHMTGGNFKVSGTGSFGGNTDWILNDLTFQSSGSTTKIGTGSVTVTDDLSIGAGHVLNAGSSSYLVSGDWTNLGVFTAGTSTVILNGTGSQAVTSGGSAFNNLNHTDSGTASLVDGLSVSGNLINTNGIWDANGKTVTVAGLTTVSGGSYQAGTGLQTHNGGLTISGGAYTGSTGLVDVNGNLNQSGGTLTAPSTLMTVSGNFAHTGGTFNNNNGTVVLDGTGQTISGSTTFNNLTKTVSAADTLTVQAGTTQTVQGNLTLSGASGAPLSLRSSNAGTAWEMDVQGSVTSAQYADVKDLNLGNSANPVVFTNSTNSGGTTGATFYVPPVQQQTVTQQTQAVVDQAVATVNNSVPTGNSSGGNGSNSNSGANAVNTSVNSGGNSSSGGSSLIDLSGLNSNNNAASVSTALSGGGNSAVGGANTGTALSSGINGNSGNMNNSQNNSNSSGVFGNQGDNSSSGRSSNVNAGNDNGSSRGADLSGNHKDLRDSSINRKINNGTEQLNRPVQVFISEMIRLLEGGASASSTRLKFGVSHFEVNAKEVFKDQYRGIEDFQKMIFSMEGKSLSERDSELETEEGDARIVLGNIVGDVKIVAEDGTIYEAEANQALKKGDQVWTSPTGSVELITEGKDEKVQVQPGSAVNVDSQASEQSSDADTEQGQTVVPEVSLLTLAFGKMSVAVSSHEGSSFVVRAPTEMSGIRG